MGLASTPTSRNLVIASVQTGSVLTPIYQEEALPPSHRPNGGDLMKGDTWLELDTGYLYLWEGLSWIPIGGTGVFELIQHLTERVARLEETLYPVAPMDDD